jgi:hypothetical protein
MNSRGKTLYDELEKVITITAKKNYLITTRFLPTCNSSGFDTVIGPEQLDSVWPPEVKGLGKPYASNRTLVKLFEA